MNIYYFCDDCALADSVPDMVDFADRLKARGIRATDLIDFYDQFNESRADISDRGSEAGSANSGVSIPTPQRLQPPSSRLSKPNDDFIIVKGANDPLSNFFTFRFLIDGIKFNSLEQAYQYFKAVKCFQFQLAQRILNARSSAECKKLAKFLHLPSVVTHSLMSMLLREKYLQCSRFRHALRVSGDKELLHSTYPADRSPYCTGLHFRDIERHRSRDFSGLNHFGRMLMNLRQTAGSSAEMKNYFCGPDGQHEVSEMCFSCNSSSHSTIDCPHMKSTPCKLCDLRGHTTDTCPIVGNRFFKSYAGDKYVGMRRLQENTDSTPKSQPTPAVSSIGCQADTSSHGTAPDPDPLRHPLSITPVDSIDLGPVRRSTRLQSRASGSGINRGSGGVHSGSFLSTQ